MFNLAALIKKTMQANVTAPNIDDFQKCGTVIHVPFVSDSFVKYCASNPNLIQNFKAAILLSISRGTNTD